MQNYLVTASMLHELLFPDALLLNNLYHFVHQLLPLHTSYNFSSFIFHTFITSYSPSLPPPNNISDDFWNYQAAMGLLSVLIELKHKQSNLRENLLTTPLPPPAPNCQVNIGSYSTVFILHGLVFLNHKVMQY